MVDNHPKVSIVLPVYQVESYIKFCVQSIVNQSYKDFEVVIVDDGSLDNSIAIAESVLFESSISYQLIRQKNRGLSSARNLGILKANGNWVVCVDSDDCLDEHFLQTLVTNAERTDVDVSICGFRYVTSYPPSLYKKEKLRYKVYESLTLQKYFLLRKIIIIIPCLLIKKDILVKNGLTFNEKILFSEDQEFIWRLLSLSLHFAVSEAKLYNYLIRPNSIMTTMNRDKILTGYFGIKHMLSECNLVNKDLVLARWILGTLRTVSKITTYEEFQWVYLNIDMHKYQYGLWIFPSLYVKIIFLINCFSKRLLYLILRKI